MPLHLDISLAREFAPKDQSFPEDVGHRLCLLFLSHHLSRSSGTTEFLHPCQKQIDLRVAVSLRKRLGFSCALDSAEGGLGTVLTPVPSVYPLERGKVCLTGQGVSRGDADGTQAASLKLTEIIGRFLFEIKRAPVRVIVPIHAQRADQSLWEFGRVLYRLHIVFARGT